MFSRKRALSLLCAACMAASLLCMAKPVPTYADSLSDQLQEARDAQAELEKQIEAIQSDKSKALEEKALLDRQNDKLRSEISLLQQQSDETQARITELTQKEQEQYELFCRQVREEEERGTVSYWSVLFKASSFTDLLARMDFVNEVMDYDRQVISDLQTTRRQLTEDKAALEQQKSEMESSQTKLQQQVDAASTLIREYEETEAGHQAMLDEAAEDEARIQALIRQQQSGGSSGGSGSSGSNSGVDGYIWPTNNTRVRHHQHRDGPHPDLRTVRRTPDGRGRRCCGHRCWTDRGGDRGPDREYQVQPRHSHPPEEHPLGSHRGQGDLPGGYPLHHYAVHQFRDDLRHEQDPLRLYPHRHRRVRRVFQDPELRVHAHLRPEQRHGAHHFL